MSNGERVARIGAPSLGAGTATKELGKRDGRPRGSHAGPRLLWRRGVAEMCGHAEPIRAAFSRGGFAPASRHLRKGAPAEAAFVGEVQGQELLPARRNDCVLDPCPSMQEQRPRERPATGRHEAVQRVQSGRR